MNNTNHSYRDRVALPTVKPQAKAEAIGFITLLAFAVLMVLVVITYGPSIFAVTVAAIAIP